MNEWIEISAKTVEDAIKEALSKLNVTEDKIETEIVEKESKGIFGIGSKPAIIKARLKEENKSVETANEEKSAENDNENTVKAAALEDESSNESNEVTDAPVTEKNADDSDIDFIAIAKQFLENVFEAMEIKATIDAKFNDEEKIIEINLEGDDMGVLIGKRGQTLDSLQYLTSLVVNKESSSYIKVKIDTENYRERRKETLENLARNIAHKVKRTRKPVSLEPMNPYDRRIIHSALQNDKFVETHSEGEEPNRKVVVTLKKGVRDYSDNRRGNYYKNNRYSSNRYDNAKDYKKKFNDSYKKSYQSITFDDIHNNSENSDSTDNTSEN